MKTKFRYLTNIFYASLGVIAFSCAYYLEFIIIDQSQSTVGSYFFQQYIKEESYLPDVEFVKEALRFLFNMVNQ